MYLILKVSLLNRCKMIISSFIFIIFTKLQNASRTAAVTMHKSFKDSNSLSPNIFIGVYQLLICTVCDTVTSR